MFQNWNMHNFVSTPCIKGDLVHSVEELGHQSWVPGSSSTLGVLEIVFILQLQSSL